MQNLYWKNGNGKAVNLIDTPFATEEQLETFVFEHQELLEDVSIFHRQIRTGSHQGIPDMIGVDQDGRICLIELKNVTVTEDILPQILRYAVWAETSPDSLKAIWLQAETPPEATNIKWDNLELRILVIGPDFRSNVLRMSQKIAGYSIDLLKVTRFSQDEDVFILIEKLQEPQAPKVITTKFKGTYTPASYEDEHGKDATADFVKAVRETETLIKKKGWKLETKFNKYYVGFRYGNFNPFTISWSGTKAWRVDLRISEEVAQAFDSEGWQFQRFDKGFNLALFRKANPKATIGELEPLLTQAYDHISGKYKNPSTKK